MCVSFGVVTDPLRFWVKSSVSLPCCVVAFGCNAVVHPAEVDCRVPIRRIVRPGVQWGQAEFRGVASAAMEVYILSTFSNPPFLDQECSFTGHVVANPATNFTKKTERGMRRKDKKKHTHEHTVLNKQKTHYLRVQMLADLSVGIL